MSVPEARKNSQLDQFYTELSKIVNGTHLVNYTTGELFESEEMFDCKNKSRILITTEYNHEISMNNQDRILIFDEKVFKTCCLSPSVLTKPILVQFIRDQTEDTKRKINKLDRIMKSNFNLKVKDEQGTPSPKMVTLSRKKNIPVRLNTKDIVQVFENNILYNLVLNYNKLDYKLRVERHAKAYKFKFSMNLDILKLQDKGDSIYENRSLVSSIIQLFLKNLNPKRNDDQTSAPIIGLSVQLTAFGEQKSVQDSYSRSEMNKKKEAEGDEAYGGLKMPVINYD